jgi:hypothetical protein
LAAIIQHYIAVTFLYYFLNQEMEDSLVFGVAFGVVALVGAVVVV